jgi:tRNA nucleotidyltransferase (CCA-adding enzyme)
MTLSEVGDFAKRLGTPESVRRKLPQEAARVREVMGRLSIGIRFMRKSEAFRQLELLTQEGRLFVMARTHSDDVKKAVSGYITYAESLRPIATGEDLKNMGIKEGPVFREILDALKEAKIDRNLATREEELAFVRSYAEERSIPAGEVQ